MRSPTHFAWNRIKVSLDWTQELTFTKYEEEKIKDLHANFGIKVSHDPLLNQVLVNWHRDYKAAKPPKTVPVKSDFCQSYHGSFCSGFLFASTWPFSQALLFVFLQPSWLRELLLILSLDALLQVDYNKTCWSKEIFKEEQISVPVKWNFFI